jgi:hypothetical protein
MKITDFDIADLDSAHDVTTRLEIEAALSKRDDAGMNSFWLFHGTRKFPSINIMVNGDLAYVYYFPEERHPGYASVGNLPHLPRGGITNFFDGPGGGEPFDILNEAVVPFSEALKVAQEFAVSKAMPKCIPWNSLLGE